jgi:tetratricopeptide (TPR) repeat protein
MTNQTVISYISSSRIDMRNAVNSGKYLTAKKITIRLLQVNPRDGDIMAYQTSINKELKKFAEVFYQKAQSFYDRELYEDRITQARTSLIYDPDLEKTRDLLSLALTDLTEKQSIYKANELFRNKNYLAALKMVNYILSHDPDNPDASSIKARVMGIFRANEKGYLDEGVSYYTNSEFDKSIEDFDIVLLVDPGNNMASDYKTRAESKQKELEKLGEIQEQ